MRRIILTSAGYMDIDGPLDMDLGGKKESGMKCEKCGRGIAEGVTLLRQNEKGVPGIWRCRDCNELPIDPDEDELLRVIENG